MSEPIPESVPTSQDPRSRRPVKKRALTPVSEQAGKVEALFAKPDREIHIPIAATKDGAPKAQPLPPEIVQERKKKWDHLFSKNLQQEKKKVYEFDLSVDYIVLSRDL